MYVCMCIHTTYAKMQHRTSLQKARIHTCMYVHVHVCMRIYIYIYVNMYMFARVHKVTANSDLHAL